MAIFEAVGVFRTWSQINIPPRLELEQTILSDSHLKLIISGKFSCSSLFLSSPQEDGDQFQLILPKNLIFEISTFKGITFQSSAVR